MCNICDDFKSGKITTEEAYKRISNALVDQNDSEKIGHLIGLSDTILDKEIPQPEDTSDFDRLWAEENEED